MTTAAPSRPEPRPRLFWITEASTGLNHLVTEAGFVNGMKCSGSYVGLCGGHFSAAPMIEAPQGTCAACRAVLVRGRTRCRSEARDRSWWRRLRGLGQSKPVTR